MSRQLWDFYVQNGDGSFKSMSPLSKVNNLHNLGTAKNV